MRPRPPDWATRHFLGTDQINRDILARLMYGFRNALIFALVVVVAGGVREELQRAFLLRRFEVYLGGSTVGVVVASTAFGAGHVLQGADAVITTGLLGAFWGLVSGMGGAARSTIDTTAG